MGALAWVVLVAWKIEAECINCDWFIQAMKQIGIENLWRHTFHPPWRKTKHPEVFHQRQAQSTESSWTCFFPNYYGTSSTNVFDAAETPVVIPKGIWTCCIVIFCRWSCGIASWVLRNLQNSRKQDVTMSSWASASAHKSWYNSGRGSGKHVVAQAWKNCSQKQILNIKAIQEWGTRKCCLGTRIQQLAS